MKTTIIKNLFSGERRKQSIIVLVEIVVLLLVLGYIGYSVYQSDQSSTAYNTSKSETNESGSGNGSADDPESTESDPNNPSESADSSGNSTAGGSSGSSGNGTSGPGSSSGSGSPAPPPCTYSGPLTISSGGTYTGCYESTSAGTPAITIATTQAVTLNRVTIKHKGFGVFSQSHRANLIITDSTFIAQPDSSPVEQKAIYAYMPTVLVIEHNQFTDGHGITVNGDNDTTSPFRIKYNNFTNNGRYNAPGCCIGAIQTDKVLAPGGQIQWNRITATYGQSLSEDAFGIYQTNGGSGNPLNISYNLVNGSYPFSGDGSGFTGGAFDFGDAGGSWIYGTNNTAVNYTNNGFMIPSGDNITHENSVAVYDGKAGIDDSGPVVVSVFGAGVTTWNNPGYPVTTNASILGVTAGHWRLNGVWERSDFYLPACGGCNYSGNTSLGTVNAAAEQAAINNFESSVTSAGVIIGPHPVMGASVDKRSALEKAGDYLFDILVLAIRLQVY